MISTLKKPLVIFLLASFIIASWPFIQYPLTDGDIKNWTWVAKDVYETGRFLTGPNDQTHGPLMAWTAGILVKPNPTSFYLYSLFTILMTVLGTWMTYFFSRRFWKDVGVAKLNTLIFVTALAPVYLSRTPMYDWPATICYFGFCGFYLMHIFKDQEQTGDKKHVLYLLIALAFVGIGSLARFSIVMGLSGIFMLIVSAIYRRSLVKVFRDGIAIAGAALLFNTPWIIGQTLTHGEEFYKPFIYDNLGRFVKSTRKNAEVRLDFYGFTLYAIVGLLPYTFCLLNTVFQKGFLARIKKDKLTLAIIAGFLPCLILFSMSGHTKLGRYIAYIFPMMILFLGSQMVLFDLDNPKYRKRCGIMTGIITVIIAILLGIEAYLFQAEVQQSPLFVASVILLLVGLLATAYVLVTRYATLLKTSAEKCLIPFVILYLIFFSALSYEYDKAPFLDDVRRSIIHSFR